MLFRPNLLQAAFNLIPHQQIEILRFKELNRTAAGIDVIEYETPEQITAIVQPVPVSLYAELKLDLAKKYIYIHALTQIHGIDTQLAPDRFIINQKIYDVYEVTDWFHYNGWASVMAVEVTNDQ